MSARTSLSGSKRSGTNNGSMTLAMNRTVINGTPRTNSMKITDKTRTAGRLERRPSARNMPIGSDATIPTVATTTVTSTPPHSDVETATRPIGGNPYSSTMDRTGSTTKKYAALITRRGAEGQSSQAMPNANAAKNTST